MNKFLTIPSWAWKTMKLSFLQFFLLTAFCGISYGYETRGQNVLEKTITLSADGLRLKKVLSLIESRSGVRFIYSSSTIDMENKININVANKKLDLVLNDLLNPLAVDYSVVDNRILLRKTVLQKKNLLNDNQSIQDLEPVDKSIRGKVTDEKGEGLPGVSVLVKGTQQGTVSDGSGVYSLSVPNDNAVLVYSFVGYTSQEITVGNRSAIDISLKVDEKGLEEVVVVGYSTQKRVNLTGSVATVTSQELERRTVTKASTALQGQMSGISVRQTSGNPGSNSASMVIRGQGTFSGAGNSPLVLVDGIESSIDNVDPSDIESVSILKDAASAAIFGSKAANGVILVETKKGVSGKPVFNYNMYVGQANPTMIPEMVNSWEYAQAVNENFTYAGQPARYSAADIQKFKDGNDPNFPNFDHIGYLFGSGSGLESKHDISMRGGTEQTQYSFSTGFYRQNGIIMKNNANRYNVRLNLDSKLHRNLKLSVRLSAIKTRSTEPSSPYLNAEGSGGGVGGIVSGAMRNANLLPGPTPDGFFSRNETLHPEADLNSASFIKNAGTSLYGNGSLIWDITKDLKITGQIGYTQSNTDYKSFVGRYPITPTYGITLNSLLNRWEQGTGLTLQSIAEYNKTIRNHTIGVLAGIQGQRFESKLISAFRDDFPNNSIYEIDAGATTRGRQNGSASRNTLASYFGRVNYNFKEKYLLEANFRYDGSSRFPQDKRWGLFPSFSAGWRVSQEQFFQDAVSWMSDVKLRASWGRLGNQSIGNYPYQYLVSLGQNYPFGAELAAGGAVTSVSNRNITWESTAITDIGIDLALLKNRISFSADYFIKNTSDILYNVSVSQMLGATPSPTNAGAVQNKGWDFNIRYRNTAGAFSYGASAVLSFVKNKVTKLATLERDINARLFVGHPIGSAYGFQSDGLFVTDAEVAEGPTQPFAFLASAGGIKFKDISGPNGVPDGVVNATYDRTIIGMPLPTSTYGITLNGGYKNLDISFLFQGEGGRKDMISLGQFFFPLENNGNVQREAFENRWTKENPNPNASYPKMSIISSGFYNTNPVDFWYRSATFIRLKNAQIGYTLPKSLMKKTFLDNVRIYVSGENLFTLTNYYKGWDPEMAAGGSAWFYPLSKLYTAGINVRF